MRCFISINLQKNVRDEIKKIQQILPKFKGKKTEFENLHLTLKFLGEVDDEKIIKIKDTLNKIKFPEFTAEIDSMGVFSEKNIGIVWLHMKGAEDLQKAVDKILEGIFDKEKRFMSHITIARVKNVNDMGEFLNSLKKIKIPEIKFMVNEFFLMSSNLKEKGPEYEVMEKFNCSN